MTSKLYIKIFEKKKIQIKDWVKGFLFKIIIRIIILMINYRVYQKNKYDNTGIDYHIVQILTKLKIF